MGSIGALLLAASCGGSDVAHCDTGTPLSCPSLPSQVKPNGTLEVMIYSDDPATAIRTITASVARRRGYVDLRTSETSSAISATVDRIAAEIVCTSTVVTRVSEFVTYCPY